MFIALGATLLAACGLTDAQKGAIRQFGEAAKSFGQIASDEIVALREEVIEINAGVLQFKAAQEGVDPFKLEGGLTTEVVGSRLRAARALQSYGELLIAVVDDTQENELRAAADGFTKSIRGLDADKTKLDDKQLESLGQLVTGIGSWWVESKKKKALVGIVPSADPQVKAVCELFAMEFDEDGVFTVEVHTRGLLAISAAERTIEAGTVPLADRGTAVELHRRGLTAVQKAKEVCPKICDSAAKMIASHARMVALLGDSTVLLDDLKALVGDTKKLAAAVKVLAGK